MASAVAPKAKAEATCLGTLRPLGLRAGDKTGAVLRL